MWDISHEVESILHHVAFPFLIIHDPGDSITPFMGSQLLAERAITPNTINRGREVLTIIFLFSVLTLTFIGRPSNHHSLVNIISLPVTCGSRKET